MTAPNTSGDGELEGLEDEVRPFIKRTVRHGYTYVETVNDHIDDSTRELAKLIQDHRQAAHERGRREGADYWLTRLWLKIDRMGIREISNGKVDENHPVEKILAQISKHIEAAQRKEPHD